MKNPIFKKYMNLVMIIGLILGFVVFAGCTDKPKITNQTPNVSVITQPSTIPTTYHYVKSIREIPGNDTNVTNVPTIVIPVPKPTLENVDVTTMEFARYDNGIVEIMYPKGWNVTEVHHNTSWCYDRGCTSITTVNKFAKEISFSNPSNIVFYNITIWEEEANSWRMTEKKDWVYGCSYSLKYKGYDLRDIMTPLDHTCSVDSIRTCTRYGIMIQDKEVSSIVRTVTMHYSYMFTFSTTNTSVFNHYKNVGDYMTGMVRIKDIRTT